MILKAEPTEYCISALLSPSFPAEYNAKISEVDGSITTTAPFFIFLAASSAIF